MSKETGIVKWFNCAKGFGFIVPEGGGEDVFIHHINIDMEGYRQLNQNQEVEFELNVGEKGNFATNVVPC